MANIKIDNLRPAGSELFADTEGYLDDLTTDELRIWGGGANISVGVTGVNYSNISVGNQQRRAGQGNPVNVMGSKQAVDDLLKFLKGFTVFLSVI